MKVRMRVPVSGTRGGEEWPPVGAILDCGDDEAYELMRMGIAGPPGTLDDEDETPPTVDDVTSRPVEAATQDVRAEKAVTPPPARKGAGVGSAAATESSAGTKSTGKGIQPGQR